MLSPYLNALKAYRIILASQSPRRSEMLASLALDFTITPSTFEEDLDKALFPTPDLYVMETAKQKALEVAGRTQSIEGIKQLVISSDTVVVLDGEILEKPKDEEDAFSTLSRLSGRPHDVYSAVTLVLLDEHSKVTDLRVFNEKTSVVMGKLSSQTIKAYIKSGEPMDKAGSYGIQGSQCRAFVKEIHGCYNNVVGFPLNSFCCELPSFLDLKSDDAE